eukprot:3139063-Alexandrium_andersonii.AAC.1
MEVYIHSAFHVGGAPISCLRFGAGGVNTPPDPGRIPRGGSATGLVGVVGCAWAWAWARNEQNLGHLTRLACELKAMVNTFGHRYLVEESGNLKSEMGVAKFEVELRNFEKAEPKIKELTAYKDRLLKAHKAFTGQAAAPKAAAKGKAKKAS